MKKYEVETRENGIIEITAVNLLEARRKLVSMGFTEKKILNVVDTHKH